MLRQSQHLAREARRHRVHIASGQLYEHGKSGRAFDHGRELGPMGTEEEVAFPVSRHDALIDLRRTIGDRRRTVDLAPPLTRDRVVHAATHRPSRPQMRAQCAREHAARSETCALQFFSMRRSSLRSTDHSAALVDLLASVFFGLVATGRITAFRPFSYGDDRSRLNPRWARILGWTLCAVSAVLAMIAFAFG